MPLVRLITSFGRTKSIPFVVVGSGEVALIIPSHGQNNSEFELSQGLCSGDLSPGLKELGKGNHYFITR